MRRTSWRSGLLWICVFALTVVTMGWVSRQESDYAISQNAEQSAIRWTRVLVGSVPDLERLFADKTLTTAARTRLIGLHKEDGVYRFKLFDDTGRLVLLSTDLDKPALPRYDSAPAEAGQWEAGTIDPVVRGQLQKGIPNVVIGRTAIAGGPRVYGAVDIPVIREGRILGLAQLTIDQTQRADSADEGLRPIVLVVSLLLAMIVALAAFQHFTVRRSQRKAEEKLRYLAQYDALSGALNRASLMAALEKVAARSGDRAAPFALLRIDLDRFKDINDALGHAIGDEVLKSTTERLRGCLGTDDRLARLEGDEFAILVLGPGTREAVTPIVRQVQRALAEPMEVSGHHVRCSGSIGIALYGVDGRAADELMTHAELALFRAKSSGRGVFVFHEAEREVEILAQRGLTRDLRSALANRQLSVHYQPLFDNDAETLVGYEALLRWQHPSRGDVPPAVFVPLAEAGGLIDEIGLWVLRKACRDAARWPESLGVAVNLSANQFASGKLDSLVARTLAESGLAAERLCLEITESSLLDNSERVMATLRKLGAIGVSIAMDDFGTGFSSLAYLWRFPFDKIKIDQVFTKHMINDPKVAMIVRSIVMLAHSLEIRINAEGVETAEQLAALQDLGCHELQGFLLGRPAPVEVLTHQGHAPGPGHMAPRGEARESLFATIAMDLPDSRHGL